MTLGLAERQGDLLDDLNRFCEQTLPANSVFALLNRERDRLFPDELFADLFSDRGRRSVPPSVVATVMVLQRLDGLSDREAVDRYAFDARWRYAAGVGGYDGDGWGSFAHTVLVDMRARLAASEDPKRIFRVTLEAASKAALILLYASMAVKIVKQYERGVLFRFGRIQGIREPGLRIIVPFVDVMHRVSLRIITMPIQSQGIITRDNVSVDVSAVAYFRVIDPVKSVVDIENLYAATDQIAQTTLRKVVGQHTLDETLSETDSINLDIRAILDVTTVAWGVEVTLVELKDIQLPDGMKRAMAKQAEAEREKRAKIINAEGEHLAAAALGEASDIMMAHPLALQLRNLQSLVEIGVDKNTTVVFPAPLMSTIGELGTFLARESAAAALATPLVAGSKALRVPAPNGVG